jgi:transposase
MIGLGSDAKVLVYTRPIDFRAGIDTLIALVQNRLGMRPFSGAAYVFRSKRRDRLKILWWDQTGIWLMTKRAESREGFSWPQEHDGTYRLNASQFTALVSCMDWRRVHASRRVLAPNTEVEVNI